MPRRKKLERWEWLTLAVEERDLRLIEEVARREGVSRSEMVRRILREWLEGEARLRYGLRLTLQPGAQAAAADPELDPLTRLEVEELRKGVQSLEREVAALENLVDRMERLGWGWGGTGTFPSKQQLKTKVYDRLKRWHSLRKLYGRLRPFLSREDAQLLAERLVCAKKSLEHLLERLK